MTLVTPRERLRHLSDRLPERLKMILAIGSAWLVIAAVIAIMIAVPFGWTPPDWVVWAFGCVFGAVGVWLAAGLAWFAICNPRISWPFAGMFVSGIAAEEIARLGGSGWISGAAGLLAIGLLCFGIWQLSNEAERNASDPVYDDRDLWQAVRDAERRPPKGN